MNKKRLFKIIAVSLPFLLILIIEVFLRLIGYGENYQLFNRIVAENQTEYLVMNSNLSKKYFKNTGFHSDNQSDLFLKTKTDSTYRIFVQGASTVVGFPFYRGGSFPRMLKHRLSRTFPEKNIEVVNTGITAVNSYTLWDITDMIIDQKPDLVIIYAGHNEYYGSLGVGSSTRYGSHPAMVRMYLKLKNLRFFQLLDNGFSKLFNSGKKGKMVGETTLMEVMAKEQRIPMDSDLYTAGIDQFESNMARVIAKYEKNGIPVILSTVVSNEKDIKPFISEELDKKSFEETLEQDPKKASELARNNAMAAYLLGRYHLEKEPDSAKKYLHLAKELDFLRFRAPEQINERIVELSKNEDLSLVDMKKVFLSYEPEGIIGNELLTEHVHPNVKGYFIMADAFYNKIREMNLIGTWDHAISYDEAFNDLPITKIDSLTGKLMVDDLKKSWPYELKMSGERPVPDYYSVQNPSFEEMKAVSIYTNQQQWEDVMTQAYHKYNGDRDYKSALRVAQSLIFEFSEQPKVYQMAGEMCQKLKDTAYADYYFAKSRRLEKGLVNPE